MYFGVSEQSTKYKRIDYSILDVLGDIGGVMDALRVLMAFVVFQIVDININCNILQVFDFLLEKEEEVKFQPDANIHSEIEKDGGHSEISNALDMLTPSKTSQFNTFKFQFKLFVLEKLCCSNRFAERIFLMDKKFAKK